MDPKMGPHGPIWAHGAPPGSPKVNFLIDFCSGMGGLELIRGFPGSRRTPRIPSDPAEVVAATAVRTPPSTRAGGQDDVS